MGISSGMDLDPLMFEGDREIRRQLMDDRPFARAAKEIKRAAPAKSARRALLANALKLTRGIAPDAFSALKRCKKLLKIKGKVELYCIQQPELNAFVTESPKGRVLVALSSGLVQSLYDDELAFVIGHELGHALFDHLSLHPQSFADHANIAPLHMAKLYAWSRYAELSADRVGLFCCGSFDVAVRASFKVTSGLTDERFMENAYDCAAQYAELSAEQLDSSADDWFSTHPYSPMRMKALDLFARSITYHSMKGSDSGELNAQTVENEVRAIMQLMDPTFLAESGPNLDDLRDFLALAGRWVALADGRETADETAVIDRMLAQDGPAPNREHIRLMTEDQMAEKLVSLGEKLNIALPNLRKFKLIEDLLAVAMADQILHDAELDALADIAMLLDADRMSVDTTLSRVEGAID